MTEDKCVISCVQKYDYEEVIASAILTSEPDIYADFMCF